MREGVFSADSWRRREMFPHLLLPLSAPARWLTAAASSPFSSSADVSLRNEIYRAEILLGSPPYARLLLSAHKECRSYFHRCIFCTAYGEKREKDSYSTLYNDPLMIRHRFEIRTSAVSSYIRCQNRQSLDESFRHLSFSASFKTTR